MYRTYFHNIICPQRIGIFITCFAQFAFDGENPMSTMPFSKVEFCIICQVSYMGKWIFHYENLRNIQLGDVIMSAMASQITSLTIVCSTVYSGAAQRKHQSSASQVFVQGIHRWPVNSPHKGPTTRKMFPFDDVIISLDLFCQHVPPVGGHHERQKW